MADPLLGVETLLVLPLVLGEHVVHLGLVDFNREDMCWVVNWPEVSYSSRNRK